MEGKEIEVRVTVRKTKFSFLSKSKPTVTLRVFFNLSYVGLKPVWDEQIKVQSKSFKTG